MKKIIALVLLFASVANAQQVYNYFKPPGMTCATINAQTGTTYTLVVSDQCVTMNNASANTITIPASTFPVGAIIQIQQIGTGITSIANTNGMSFTNNVPQPGAPTKPVNTQSQYGVVTIRQTASNVWNVDNFERTTPTFSQVNVFSGGGNNLGSFLSAPNGFILCGAGSGLTFPDTSDTCPGNLGVEFEGSADLNFAGNNNPAWTFSNTASAVSSFNVMRINDGNGVGLTVNVNDALHATACGYNGGGNYANTGIMSGITTCVSMDETNQNPIVIGVNGGGAPSIVLQQTSLKMGTGATANPTTFLSASNTSGPVTLTIGDNGNATSITNIVGGSAANTQVNGVQIASTQTGTFTITYTGMTASVTGTAVWTLSQNIAALYFPAATGTSNATNFTATGLPAAIQPTRTQRLSFPNFACENNTTVGLATDCEIIVTAASGTVTFLDGGNAAGWTNSGTKGVANAATVTYLVN